MLISVGIPVHARTHDLKQCLPSVLDAALKAPLVELVLVDYSSPDDLRDYASIVFDSIPDDAGVVLRLVTVPGRSHYHMAHGKNVCIKQATGEYFLMAGADSILVPQYFVQMRQLIAETGADYLHPRTPDMRSMFVARRQTLLDIGGLDERFEFYSPDDKDLHNRICRCGCRVASYPNAWIDMIRTSDADRVKHYRITDSKHGMHRRMQPIFAENEATQRVVVNEGAIWGETWAARTDGVPTHA